MLLIGYLKILVCLELLIVVVVLYHKGQSLNMTLSPVSTSLLKNAVQGEPLTSISADTFLSIRCEPNAVGAFRSSFSAYDRLSTQPI